jgi:prophage DNA circulation protein
MAGKITDLKSGEAWRQYLQPAQFKGARFYVNAAVRDSGRRIVQHEFPKRDVPYGEDMGRRAREFSVRGYLIAYPRDNAAFDLQKKNYLIPRDALIKVLEEEGPADLQLPFLGVLKVVCTRYRVSEEDKYGGYCTIDMSFFEYGQAPAQGNRQSAPGVFYASQKLGEVTQNIMEAQITKVDTFADRFQF